MIVIQTILIVILRPTQHLMLSKQAQPQVLFQSPMKYAFDEYLLFQHSEELLLFSF